MTRIFYDSEVQDAVGSTAGTLETIATVRTDSEATDIIAFLLQKANTSTRTAGEANQGEFVINPRALGFDVMRTQSLIADGGAPATNIEAFVEDPKWFPFMPIINQVSNKRITFQYDAQTPEPTAEMAAQVTVIQAKGSYPLDVISNVGRLVTRTNFAETQNDPDIGNAASEAFPSTMEVPGWVNELTAIGITIGMDAAPSGGEHLIGHIDVGGSMGDMDPMEVPIPAIHASLGTPVGGSVLSKEHILPFYVKTPGVDTTLDFTAVIESTLSGVVNASVSVYGRGKINR